VASSGQPAKAGAWQKRRAGHWHHDVIEDFTAGRLLMQSELAPIPGFHIASNLVGLQDYNFGAVK
jgi:hypothetical protein